MHKLYSRKTCNCLTNAIIDSSPNIVIKAIANGYTYDPKNIKHTAAFFGNFYILQYLYTNENGCKINEDIALAAGSSGIVKRVAYVLKNLHCVPCNFVYVLITNGYIKCLKLLVTKYRITFNRKNINQADFFGQYECLKYILANCPISLTINLQTFKLILRGRNGQKEITTADNFIFISKKVLRIRTKLFETIANLTFVYFYVKTN